MPYPGGDGNSMPGGTGTQLQYRFDATTFGGITGSSFAGGIVNLGANNLVTTGLPTFGPAGNGNDNDVKILGGTSGGRSAVHYGSNQGTETALAGYDNELNMYFVGTKGVTSANYKLAIDRDIDAVGVKDCLELVTDLTVEIDTTAGEMVTSVKMKAGGIPAAFVGVADTAGLDTNIRAQDGGAHSAANPRGGDINFIPGAAGAGGSGRAGIVNVQGGLQVGNTDATADGLIRYTGTDIEGRIAGAWVSLGDVSENLVLGKAVSTGIVNGGLLSINVDTTKFDISDGRGYITDKYTTPAGDNVPLLVTWTGLTAQIPAHSATITTFVAIDNTGSVVQQGTSFTNAQRKTLLVLGSVIAQDTVNVDSVSDRSTDSNSSFLASGLAHAIGDINTSGNAFTSAASNLTIAKSAGTSFDESINRVNNLFDPDDTIDAAIASATFNRAYNDGVGGLSLTLAQTTIDPEFYDDGSGVLAAVPNNHWQNKLISFFPSTGLVVVQYGEETYAQEDAAIAAAPSQQFTQLIAGLGSIVIRTVLTVQDGTTDLDNATFLQTSRFGHNGSGGGPATAIQSMQSTYNNSVTPTIITNTTGGAVNIQRGSALDTDVIIDFRNGAGSVVGSITGEGKATFVGLTMGGQATTDILISSDAASTSDVALITAGFLGTHQQAIRKNITQATHGFSVGDWLRLSGSGTYVLAKADSATNAEVVGVVTTDVGTNDFILTMQGYVTGMPSVAVNTGFVLDPSTAGAKTSTAPTTVGQINKFIFRSDAATTGYVQIMRGIEVGSAAEGAKFWVNFNGTGTIAIRDSFNVTSLTDNGTGDYTVTIATDFATGDWAPSMVAALFTTQLTSTAAGTVRLETKDAAGANDDPTIVSVAGWGDQ